jgi:hypothetical protein
MFSLSSMLPSGSLPELAESVRRSLSSVQAQIAAAWNVQHNDDGSHRDVTATSVRVAAIGHSRVYTHTVVTLANDVVEIPAGVSFVEFTTPAAIGSTFTLRGIRQYGVQEGDMLWLRVSRYSSLPTRIRNFSHTLEGVAPINTELAFPDQQASAADTNYFVMQTTAGSGGVFPAAHWVPFTYTNLESRFVWMMWMTMSGV